MKNKFNLIICLIFGIITVSKSQSIPIHVINSAGGGGPVGTTSVEVYYNIGETVISTISSGTTTVTQGFLQPDIVGKFGLTATAFPNGVSCVGKLDGFIAITASVSGIQPQSAFTLSYYWSNGACPSNNCSSINNLSPGTYSVLVVSTCTSSSVADSVKVQNIVVADNFSPCTIEIFNGVTPNGDGHNDFFYIGNIEEYPKNNVTIYNRWGQQLAHIDGYNNIDKKWDGTMNGTGNLAPTGTYFYIIDLGNGSKLFKGWLELLHN
ncbi:MAG TPA: gliding motility-associated C-terminal domain-containing protein [Bacteroidia bacterium]|jgi:gliding motility-associated-like protein|nr:gliding motility-associated C-terminal domain-containing protein [Bacteroidia bacterium]